MVSYQFISLVAFFPCLCSPPTRSSQIGSARIESSWSGEIWCITSPVCSAVATATGVTLAGPTACAFCSNEHLARCQGDVQPTSSLKRNIFQHFQLIIHRFALRISPWKRAHIRGQRCTLLTPFVCNDYSHLVLSFWLTFVEWNRSTEDDFSYSSQLVAVVYLERQMVN